jgi:hypothetical protein
VVFRDLGLEKRGRGTPKAVLAGEIINELDRERLTVRADKRTGIAAADFYSRGCVRFWMPLGNAFEKGWHSPRRTVAGARRR